MNTSFDMQLAALENITNVLELKMGLTSLTQKAIAEFNLLEDALNEAGRNRLMQGEAVDIEIDDIIEFVVDHLFRFSLVKKANDNVPLQTNYDLPDIEKTHSLLLFFREFIRLDKVAHPEVASAYDKCKVGFYATDVEELLTNYWINQKIIESEVAADEWKVVLQRRRNFARVTMDQIKNVIISMYEDV